MDNKTKVKVAVVIGIIVLAVIFIFMVVFVKGNRNSRMIFLQELQEVILKKIIIQQKNL